MNLERLNGITSTIVGEVVMVLLYTDGAVRATKYLDERTVVRASRPVYGKKKVGDKRDTRATIIVTVGAPNYLERDAIKEFKKAGEPFPVKKIMLKMIRVVRR